MTKKPGKRELWEGLFAREYVVDLTVEVARATSQSKKSLHAATRAFLLLSLLALFAMPALAQNHPAAISGNCNNTNNCSFVLTGGLVAPGPNQVMVMLVSGPGDNETLSSISDAYGIGGSCSGSTCGGWTRFGTGCHAHSNANQGISAQMCGYWAKTGTNSGAMSVTLTWSTGGTARYMPLSSWSGTDVMVSATNVEDVSTFHEDTNANSCTAPSPVSGTFSTSAASEVVISLIDYNTVFDEPSGSNSTGATQNVIAVSRHYYFANLATWNGITGVLAPVSAGVNTITWTWGSCVNTAGNAGVFTVVLKPGVGLGGVAKRKHPPYIIKNRVPTKPGIIRVSLEDYR